MRAIRSNDKAWDVRRRASRFALGVAVIVAAACAGGCKHTSSAANPVFELQPRPVLKAAGISSTWDPRISVDTAGGLYLFTVYEDGSNSRLGVSRSESGGDTFDSQIVPISEPRVSISSHGEQSPSAVTTISGIFALWQEQAAGGASKIMAARSVNWGESFEKPVQVSDAQAASFRGFPSIAVSPNGDVYATWLDERDMSPASKEEDSSYVYLAKSSDHGASFGSNVRVGDHTCPCCRPSLAFGPKGEVYVAWRRVFPGQKRDMVVSTSVDGGRTFADPVRVNSDGWKIEGCPDSGPTLVESGSNLWIAWMTAGNNNLARIYVSSSVDGGHSFRAPVLASGDVLDPNHPSWQSGAPGTLWLVFQGRAPSATGSWSQNQAFLTRVASDGTASVPFAIPGSETSVAYPRVALGYGGQMYVAWTQSDGGHFIVMLSRGRVKG